MSLIFVDCEASGPCPSQGFCTEFGAVEYKTHQTFHGVLHEEFAPCTARMPVTIMAQIKVMQEFETWLKQFDGKPVFVSDNPAFDWQWINDLFWRHLNYNPFGHSARRISDFYAGLCNDFHKTQQWKRFRKTPHDHNPVHDSQGNLEAFERLLKGDR